MNWETEATVTLGEERERLAREHDQVEQLQQGAEDEATASAYGYSANEIAQMGAAVDYLIRGNPDDEADEFEGYGADATVTVRGLSAGLHGWVTDRVESLRERRDDVESARGYHRNVFAAAGLVDAPFVDLEAAADAVTHPGSSTDYEGLTPTKQRAARVSAVEDLPPNVTRWLFDLVDDQTGVGQGNWKASSGQPQGTTSE